ncbi:ornithine cyclodeaminase family protein [Pseudonocardia kujensis]|uniref:ornithine cyclodeaminase family protein n=1 Tax=Pseudonocardia kujensis TaxID=1128675 RepID=UPI001E40DC71|nr:ornithine cyclodeaminase family protein [Pseudonocardia kujensis]MCE0761649.1 ornithine cyclodeaminase family protein [Pseudonocardia kujensis]
MRLLDRAAVRALLDPDALLDAVSTALVDLSTGRASVPPRIAAQVGELGILAAMPAYSETLGVVAAKLLTLYPGNDSLGLPTHQALVAVFAPEDGTLRALMDGDVITADRTAAASALSVRALARPDARVLAVLGTGPQAQAHARYVARMRPFEEIRIGGRDPHKVAALVDSLAAEGVTARVCTIEGALHDADVVCAATSTLRPLVGPDGLPDGVHVASVGYRPEGREVDAALLTRAQIVVEHRATTLAPYPVGSNDLAELLERGRIHPDVVLELGEVLGGLRPGRAWDEQPTVYKSVGVAVLDVAAAAVVLDAAERAGAGLETAL